MHNTNYIYIFIHFIHILIIFILYILYILLIIFILYILHIVLIVYKMCRDSEICEVNTVDFLEYWRKKSRILRNIVAPMNA